MILCLSHGAGASVRTAIVVGTEVIVIDRTHHGSRVHPWTGRLPHSV